MKLLFQTIPKTINVDALEKYRLKQCSETIIYSEEGIFSIQNNSLYKEIIDDETSSHFTIDGIDFILDKTNITKKKWTTVGKIKIF